MTDGSSFTRRAAAELTRDPALCEEVLGITETEAAREPTNSWLAIKSLTPKPRPVLPLDLGLLVGTLRAWTEDIRDRFQVPPDFVFAALVLVLAAVIGRRIVVQPKQRDGWIVTPNLWGGIVGRPGQMKSPVISKVMSPLRKLQKEAFDQYQEELEEYKRSLAVYEQKQRAHDHEAKKVLRRGGVLMPFDEKEPEKPRCARYVASDATAEKLQEILAENPQGILLQRDELAGWLDSLSKRGREGERPFYLEAWNGDGGFTCDRIGRGTVHIEHVCVSILGGIQPSKLQAYLAAALSGGADDDGLAQRLQVLVYPDAIDSWEDVDREPNREAAQRIEDICRAVVKLSPDDQLILRFDSEAQQLFSAWRKELEDRLNRDEMPPVLQSHLAKYRSLMPSLALVLHVADTAVPGPIPRQIPLIQAQRAADLCTYFESHAKRVYESVNQPSWTAASYLGDKLREGALGERFTIRDVYTKGWRGLNNSELARAAVDALESAHWVRQVEQTPGPNGGRPSEVHEVNPEVWRDKSGALGT